MPDDPPAPTPAGALSPLEIPVQPGAGGRPSAPADDPGTDALPTSPSDTNLPPAEVAPQLEVPSPPYAPVIPLAVDTGPPVPPELDDLLPPPARRSVNPPAAGEAKKGSADRRSEPVMAPVPPPWDHGPVPSPAPAPATPSPPAATPPDPDAGDEVAAAPQVALPTVKEASRRLTSATARDSLAAMALTLIVGTGWNVVSARRRRHGWY